MRAQPLRGGLLARALPRIALVAVLASPSFAVPFAVAADPAPARTPEELAAAAAESKLLNRQGVEMLKAGDNDRALDYFTRSRAVLPTSKNTTNAAITLDRLGRYDEALELYEQVLLRYAGDLDDEDRDALAPAMAALRELVGNVTVSSNVGGEVFIDNRSRGKLPFVVPIRVLEGHHTVRVERVGYASYESSFDVAKTATANVEAKLDRVPNEGQLIVEDTDGGGAAVYVDGSKLGFAPWEGSLAPGRHLLWLDDGKDHGSLPTWVEVLDQQTALVRLQPRPLGPSVTIHVEPRTATFDVDGIALGPGSWQGRLPVGRYKVAASEPGYTPILRDLVVEASPNAVDLDLHLTIDPNDPRWPKPRGAFVLQVDAGAAIGPGMNGGWEAGCPEGCTENSPAFGFLVGARAGYRFPFGLGLDFTGGYMLVHQDVQRTVDATFGDAEHPVHYDLTDSVTVKGPFFGVGVSFRAKVGKLFYLDSRLSGGVLIASSGDPVSGDAYTTGPRVPIIASRNEDTILSAAPYIAPELGAGLRFGRFDLGVALGLHFFPMEGPILDRGRFGPDHTKDPMSDASCGADPDTCVSNAPESAALDGERAYGPFALFVPQIGFTTSF